MVGRQPKIFEGGICGGILKILLAILPRITTVMLHYIRITLDYASVEIANNILSSSKQQRILARNKSQI